MTQKYICCSYTVFLIPIHVHRYLYQSFVSCMIIKSHLKSHYELVRRVWELSPEYTCGGNFVHFKPLLGGQKIFATADVAIVKQINGFEKSRVLCFFPFKCNSANYY